MHTSSRYGGSCLPYACVVGCIFLASWMGVLVVFELCISLGLVYLRGRFERCILVRECGARLHLEVKSSANYSEQTVYRVVYVTLLCTLVRDKL